MGPEESKVRKIHIAITGEAFEAIGAPPRRSAP